MSFAPKNNFTSSNNPVLDAFSPFLFYPFSSPPPPPLFCIIYTPAMRIRNTGHHARAVEEKKMAWLDHFSEIGLISQHTGSQPALTWYVSPSLEASGAQYIEPNMTYRYIGAMVLILDGNSEKGAHVRSNLCNLISLRLLIRSRAARDELEIQNGH